MAVGIRWTDTPPVIIDRVDRTDRTDRDRTDRDRDDREDRDDRDDHDSDDRDRPAVSVDAGLVKRARAGDAAAFEALYERHVDAVHRFVYVRLRDGGLARDVTQDVFLAALRGLQGLRDDARFAPWLMRIAHAAVVDHWRRVGRGPRLVPLDGGDDDVEDGAAGPRIDSAGWHAAHDGARPTEHGLDDWDLVTALGRLTELQQQVLALRFIAELSVADVATALATSEDAVKKLQRRGLAALRRRLELEMRR